MNIVTTSFQYNCETNDQMSHWAKCLSKILAGMSQRKKTDSEMLLMWNKEAHHLLTSAIC